MAGRGIKKSNWNYTTGKKNPKKGRRKRNLLKRLRPNASQRPDSQPTYCTRYDGFFRSCDRAQIGERYALTQNLER
ncbi:hypothetical protein HOA55_03625 [archaeon]|jgi:hypothetical protein|nr:hypothetical protein [archaeon]MBT3577337.1 hypothetical protein [archaeon]MBT6820419.1 hypothetical protein [archaeon]MBT6956765.1 hypothetical protein [archaeon]MBT7025233.1 hypothetical protein [archaeon]